MRFPLLALLILSSCYCSCFEALEGCPQGCPQSCRCTSLVKGSLVTITCSSLTAADNISQCVGPDVAEFYVESSELNSISNEDFQNASNLTLIQLSNSENLTSIEVGAFDNLLFLSALIIQNTGITDLPDQIFANLSGLSVLELQHNRIKSITENAFNGLTSLQSLHLLGNDISEIKDNAFKDLNALTSLILGSNMITSVGEDTLSGLHQLEDLQIQNNLLTDVDTRAFSGLPYLKTLNLEFNKVMTLPSDFFANLTELNEIYLKSNEIKDLEAFSYPSNLVTIKLERNALEVIPTGAFKGCSLLEWLDLSDMYNLRAIESQAFSGLDSLKFLALNLNPMLASFTVDMLEADKKVELEAIFINNCSITTFSQYLFLAFPNLRFAGIHGNPIHCNCDAEWMKNEMDDPVSDWSSPWKDGQEAVVCQSPVNLRGFRVYELDPFDLTCNPPVLVSNTMVLEDDKAVLQALLRRGLPSTSWVIPDGTVITPAREIQGSRGERLTKKSPLVPTEVLLPNNTILASITVNGINSDSIGLYKLTATNAGGSKVVEFNLQSPSSSGLSIGSIIGVVIATLLFIALSIGIILLFRYYKRNRPYETMESSNDNQSDEEGTVRCNDTSTAPATTSVGVKSYGGTGSTVVTAPSEPAPNVV